MDRREFFKKAFAAGIVTVVPYSIFEETSSQIEETVQMRELDFGDYRAILIQNGTVIAKSHLVNVHMVRNLLEIISRNGFNVEYIPGLMSFDIEMNDVSSDTKHDVLTEVLASDDKLEVCIRPAFDDQRYYAECFMAALEVSVNTIETTAYNIRLQGSGALIVEDNV